MGFFHEKLAWPTCVQVQGHWKFVREGQSIKGDSGSFFGAISLIRLVSLVHAAEGVRDWARSLGEVDSQAIACLHHFTIGAWQIVDVKLEQ